MSVAFFGQGMCNLGWTLLTDVAPKELMGLSAGVFNLCANLAGIVTPLVVGVVVGVTGSFAWALAFIGIVALLGVFSYVFIVGDVRRVEYRAVSEHRALKVGLIGAGIQHSSSPSMHVDEGKALGLSISYELLDFDLMQGGSKRLAALLDDAEQRGFSGLNITYPSKQAVIPLLHELAPEARALHSVNTVLFRNGKRIGHNTDWWGFAESFRRDMSDVNTDHVVLVGAGGAGAAVGYAMLKLGSRITDDP